MTKERLSELWDKHLIIGAPIGLKALREGKEKFFAAIVEETRDWEDWNKIKLSDLTPYLQPISSNTIGATKNKATYQGGESVFSMSSLIEFETAMVKEELLKKVRLIVVEFFHEHSFVDSDSTILTIEEQQKLLERIEKADTIVQRQENGFDNKFSKEEQNPIVE